MPASKIRGATPVRRGSRVYAAIVLVAAFAGVGGFAATTASSLAQPATPAPQPMVPLLEHAEAITVHTDIGDWVFTVEWALDDQQRALGLMFRPEMAQDHGMVFDFFVERPVSFWMRNTLIPLDMVFIRQDGTVFSIAEMTTPLSETGVPSGGPVRYVLEVNGGTADRISLDPGDVIDLHGPVAAAAPAAPAP